MIRNIAGSVSLSSSSNLFFAQDSASAVSFVPILAFCEDFAQKKKSKAPLKMSINILSRFMITMCGTKLSDAKCEVFQLKSHYTEDISF